jgi:hypothetical protein
MYLPFSSDDARNPRIGTIQTRPERVRDGTQTRQMFLTVPVHNLIRTAGLRRRITPRQENVWSIESWLLTDGDHRAINGPQRPAEMGDRLPRPGGLVIL